MAGGGTITTARPATASPATVRSTTARPATASPAATAAQTACAAPADILAAVAQTRVDSSDEKAALKQHAPAAVGILRKSAASLEAFAARQSASNENDLYESLRDLAHIATVYAKRPPYVVLYDRVCNLIGRVQYALHGRTQSF